MVMFPRKTLPALVIVCVFRPENVIVVDPNSPTPVPFFQSPWTKQVPGLMFMKFVRADASTVPVLGSAASMVIVWPADGWTLLMTAVSCPKGKLFVAAVPPDVAAQLLLDQLAEDGPTQYTVFGVLKVMPRQPLRFPMRVPDIGAEVPVT